MNELPKESKDIPISKISKLQVDREADRALAENIKKLGLLNPIIVSVVKGTEQSEDTKQYTISDRK